MSNAGTCQPDDSLCMKLPQPVEVEVDGRVWDLCARPDALTDAAASWRGHGDATGLTVEAVQLSCRQLLDTEQLTVDVADRLSLFESDLITKLDEYEGISERVAEQLEAAAASLRAHQKKLDKMYGAVLAKVPGRRSSSSTEESLIVFCAASFADLRTIEDATTEAGQVHHEVDRRNAGIREKLDEIIADLTMMGRALTPRGNA